MFLMKLFDLLIKLLPSKPVSAHCDIPCGIYDPHNMQMAAHTIIRMTNLINESAGDVHKIARMTHVKEEHGEKVEEELVTLWADYFKEEHLKEFPELSDLIFKSLKLTGKVRQEINPEAASELLANVQKVAEIFWKTKKMEPVRIASGYPTEGEIVSHK